MAGYIDILHWSDITLTRYLVIEFDIIGDLDLFTKFREVCIEHLQRVRLVNRERILRIPGPVPFGTCMCSDVEINLFWTCYVSGLWISNDSW